MSVQRRRDWVVEMIVGAFAFMVLLLLGTFTIILSTQNIFKEYTEFDVYFEDVMGLGEGDSIEVRGLNVGKVKALELVPDGVKVHLSMEEAIALHEGYKIQVLPGSVLGGKMLTIYEGPSSNPLVGSDERIVGELPVDFIDEASQMIQSVRESLEEGGILKNLEVTMAEFKTISTRLSEGQGTLGKLLVDETLYADLQSLAANLRTVSEEIAQGEGTLSKLIQDDTVYTDLAAITGNLKEVSDRLAKGEGTLGRLLSEDDELYENLNTATLAISEIATNIRDGKGTLGKLATDEKLYEQLEILLAEVRATVEDFRETAPITSFSSVFFGAF